MNTKNASCILVHFTKTTMAACRTQEQKVGSSRAEQKQLVEPHSWCHQGEMPEQQVNFINPVWSCWVMPRLVWGVICFFFSSFFLTLSIHICLFPFDVFDFLHRDKHFWHVTYMPSLLHIISTTEVQIQVIFPHSYNNQSSPALKSEVNDKPNKD